MHRWTRHVHITHDYDSVLDADVTLFSSEFRAAYVSKVAAMRHLPAPEQEALAALQQKAACSAVEVEVMLQSSRWEWNDLGASHSLWTITFSDDAQRSVVATSRGQLLDKPE